ncbi:Uncharacterized protein TPAR_03938 [Tolypocladium paradoxum]|uniref:Uncharacterized protein n=1 Tax=Tolypocladium paradoxum TaxID=94208 RepID=A0A2S4L091_9HYPO|nr:Uncharacterized protein TPAR_03938 [Tolypocladium paradoxum]
MAMAPPTSLRTRGRCGSFPASTAPLGGGIVFWLACYVLMARRSLATHATPMALAAPGVNVAWAAV